MKKLLYLFLALPMLMNSCSEDEPQRPGIFEGEEIVRDDFDKWLQDNYTKPYNVDFMYKMKDIEADNKYNLVPADSTKAAKLAIIAKYLWFDAYAEVVGEDFVKANVPRQIHIIGSAAYNSNNTEVLGTAEGGYKVTLYKVNELTDQALTNYAYLNRIFFHTMHHEFNHILAQKKPYDPAYGLITKEDYISGDWYKKSDAEALKKGFITPYSMSEYNEDFAEMMATYVTITASDWEAKLKEAGEKATAIKQKLDMQKKYMMSAWNLDLDKLRDAVLKRGSELDKLDLSTLK